MDEVDMTGYTEFGGKPFCFKWIISNFHTAVMLSPPVTIVSPGFTDSRNNTWKLTLRRTPMNEADRIEIQLTAPQTPCFQIVAHVRFLDSDGSVITQLSEVMVAGGFNLQSMDKSFPLGFKLSNKKEQLVNDNKLTIYCETWCKDNVENVNWVTVGPKPISLNDKQNEFVSNFIDFFNQKPEALFDFSISVDDQSYPAHKAILAARSPVFLAMLTTEMTESQTNVLNITDFPAEIVAGMLEYIYTNKIDIRAETAADYLRIGHEYDLSGLMLEAEYILVTTVTVDNAVELWKLASLYNCSVLMKKVAILIKQNLTQVLAAPACAELEQDELDAVLRQQQFQYWYTPSQVWAGDSRSVKDEKM